MKAHVQLGALTAALALASCHSTGAKAPAAPAAAPATPAEQARAQLAEELTAGTGRNSANTVYRRFFSSMFTAARQETPAPQPEPAAEEAQPENVQPTPEQQEAALQLLAGQDTLPPADGPLTLNPGATLPDAAESPFGTGEPPKAATGLRINNLAAPEEALSTDAAPEPALPNAAERRGLRGLTLPQTLPMDINGKLTTPKD